MEYVIGCLVDLLYTGLNFVPYFQKMYLTSNGYYLPIIKRSFGLVMTAHVMIRIQLSKTVRCMQVLLYICVHVYI